MWFVTLCIILVNTLTDLSGLDHRDEDIWTSQSVDVAHLHMHRCQVQTGTFRE